MKEHWSGFEKILLFWENFRSEGKNWSCPSLILLDFNSGWLEPREPSYNHPNHSISNIVEQPCQIQQQLLSRLLVMWKNWAWFCHVTRSKILNLFPQTFLICYSWEIETLSIDTSGSSRLYKKTSNNGINNLSEEEA